MPESKVESRESRTCESCRVAWPSTLNPQRSTLNQSRAFTLVEILVVVVLMALIVLALMAVFNSTQAAFRASLTQADVLEGGRNVMGLVKNDLESVTPSYLQTTNFYTAVSNHFVQPLAGGSASRSSVMEDVFFIARENQTWKGVGYFVRSNLLDSGTVGMPGVLYRFETNNSVAQFRQNPGGMYAMFDRLRRGPSKSGPGFNATPGSLPTSVSRILDGVMTFKVRFYDTNGVWINTNLVANYGTFTVTNANISVYPTNSFTGGEPAVLFMVSNALPVAVEVELGVLEDRALQRAESLADSYPALTNYLAQQAGKVHLFRQRFPIRNVDPSAYQ
jgi:hypothetical protein